jgi:hypothetical protein
MSGLTIATFCLTAVSENNGANMLMIPLIMLVAAFSFCWHFRRSRSVLDQWAEKNGFEILHSEYRHLFKGPFTLWSSKDQTVYRVRVRDREGTERSGWVRCGGWFLGLMSDRIEVKWDD